MERTFDNVPHILEELSVVCNWWRLDTISCDSLRFSEESGKSNATEMQFIRWE